MNEASAFWRPAKSKYESITWPEQRINDRSVKSHIRTLYETEISIPRLCHLLQRSDSKFIIFYVVETTLISIFDTMEQIPKDTTRFLVDVMQNWINEATKNVSFQLDETPSMLGFLLWRGFIEICSARSTEIQTTVLDFIQSFCNLDQSGLSLVEITAVNGIKDFMSLDYDSKTEYNWYKHVYFPVLIEIHHQYCVSGYISQALSSFLGDLLLVYPFAIIFCCDEQSDEYAFQRAQCQVQILYLFNFHLWLLSNIANGCTVESQHNFVVEQYFPDSFVPNTCMTELESAFLHNSTRTRSQLNLLKKRRIKEFDDLPNVAICTFRRTSYWLFDRCRYLLNHIVSDNKKELHKIWLESNLIFVNPSFQLIPLKLNQLVLASYIHRLLKFCCPEYPTNLQSRGCIFRPREEFCFAQFVRPLKLRTRENRKLLIGILQSMIGELHHDLLGFAQASLHRIHMRPEKCVLPGKERRILKFFLTIF
jgi:hypothetical protein